VTQPAVQPICVLCPDRERIPFRGLVCESCRRWLATMVTDTDDYAAQLAAPPDLVPDGRVALVPVGVALNAAGEPVKRAAMRDKDDNLVMRRRDVASWMLPSGSQGNKAGDAPVSGSREAPVPINVDAVDIMMPSRQGSVPATLARASVVDVVTANHRYVQMVDGDPEYVLDEVTGTRRLFLRDPNGFPLFVDTHDQIGHLPLAAVLDGWVRTWRDARNAGEGLPDVHIATMCRWLHTRIDWACDEFPAIADFAEEIRSYRSAMAGILGLVDVPEYKWGVACPKCKSLTLFRRIGGRPDGSLWVECSTCPAMLSPDEYATWTKERVAAISAERTDDDLAKPLMASSVASDLAV